MSELSLSPDFQAQQVLTGIRALLASFNGKSRCVLPSTRGLRIPMRLLGVWLQPPNRFGRRDWLLQRKWKDSLLAGGIDPDRIEILDESKLWMAIERIEHRAAQQKQVRAQRKEREAYLTEEAFDLLGQQPNKGWYTSPVRLRQR